MAKFFQSLVGGVSYVAGLPITAAKSTYDALTSNKNLAEAWNENEKKMDEVTDEIGEFAQKQVDAVDKFAEKHHEIDHIAKHAAPHIGKSLGDALFKILFRK